MPEILILKLYLKQWTVFAEQWEIYLPWRRVLPIA
jgi:hypothetical protein